jgi:hypothetical protein
LREKAIAKDTDRRRCAVYRSPCTPNLKNTMAMNGCQEEAMP